uniref:Malate dehydrogenase n=1 Tax=Glossina austeni TaxID=7395 RepID=A0A1A9VE73_GLOAU
MLMVGKALPNVFNGMAKVVKIQKICGLCDYIPLAAHCSPATKKTSSSKKRDFFQNDFQTLRRKRSTCANQVEKLVSVAESRRFMIDCFKAFGVPQIHAEQQADLLVAADYRGYISHGLNRLQHYLNDLSTKSAEGTAVPKILKESPATAWVDGCNGLGAVVGNFCMDLAIKKAKKVGVGWVCAKNCNHYGMCGWYPLRAMKEDLVGISMSNASPIMAPTGGKEAALGTNPISVGAKAEDDQFLLDMATAASSLGRIEIQCRRGEKIPEGWLQKLEAASTTDREATSKDFIVMPLGGGSSGSSHKGYGLGAVVEILSGVMAGANFSTKIRKWTPTDINQRANLGQLFAAIDPCYFAPNFKTNLEDLNCRLRKSQPVRIKCYSSYLLHIYDPYISGPLGRPSAVCIYLINVKHAVAKKCCLFLCPHVCSQLLVISRFLTKFLKWTLCAPNGENSIICQSNKTSCHDHKQTKHLTESCISLKLADVYDLSRKGSQTAPFNKRCKADITKGEIDGMRNSIKTVINEQVHRDAQKVDNDEVFKSVL